MLYQRPSFTLPASNNVSQMRWDMAFLPEAEFIEKYKMSAEAYAKLSTKKVK